MATVEVKYIGSNGEYQDYVPSDKALINASLITPTFGVSENDYIEYFIKDLGGVVLSANYYNTQYKLGAVDPVTGTTTALYLNPERDAANEGYDRGIVNVSQGTFLEFKCFIHNSTNGLFSLKNCGRYKFFLPS